MSTQAELVILVGCRDERNLFRLPTSGGEYHGFQYTWDGAPSKDSVTLDLIQDELKIEHREHIKILTYIENSLPSKEGVPYQLVVAEVLAEGLVAPSDWPTLPIILRSMPRGSARIAYNKAMQVFAGAMAEQTDALEVDDEVRERLKELEKDGKI